MDEVLIIIYIDSFDKFSSYHIYMTDFYMSAGIVEKSKNTADGRETSRHIATPSVAQ